VWRDSDAHEVEIVTRHQCRHCVETRVLLWQHTRILDDLAVGLTILRSPGEDLHGKLNGTLVLARWPRPLLDRVHAHVSQRGKLICI
jgi:hypothetical protein